MSSLLLSIIEVNKKVRESQEKKDQKRGEYLKLSQKEKAMIGKYASQHSVIKAVRHYKEWSLKEGSVRGLKRLYEKEGIEQSTRAVTIVI